MGRFHITEKLSEHIGETPEGFLIAYDVPVAKIVKYCECGCGQIVNNRFAKNHQNRNRKQSEIANEKRSKSLQGHRAWNKGKAAWNKGLTKETDNRIKPYSEERKNKRRESLKGRNITWGDKISAAKRGVPNNVLKEKWRDLEYKKNHSGENTSAWKGGISFEPYSSDWKETLKESIRQRDSYTCRICCISQEELKDKHHKVLDIHHIDYNKMNCDPDNLISLCKSCHMKTNYKRDKWISFFNGRNKIMETING